VDTAEPNAEPEAVEAGGLAEGEPGAPSDLGVKDLSDEDLKAIRDSEDPVAEAIARVRQLKGDYTRKTQALSERQREIEERAQRYQWAEELDDDLANDPEAARRKLTYLLQEMGGGAPAGQAAARTPADQATQTFGGMGVEQVNEMYQSMTPAEQWLTGVVWQLAQGQQQVGQRTESWERQAAQRELNTAMQTLHDRHGDFDETALLRTAHQRGLAQQERPAVDVLEDAWRILDYEHAESRGRESAYTGMEKKARASAGAAGSTTAPTQQRKAKTIDEVFAIAAQEVARGRGSTGG